MPHTTDDPKQPTGYYQAPPTRLIKKLKLERDLERIRSTEVTVEDLDYLHHRIDQIEARSQRASQEYTGLDQKKAKLAEQMFLNQLEKQGIHHNGLKW